MFSDFVGSEKNTRPAFADSMSAQPRYVLQAGTLKLMISERLAEIELLKVLMFR